MSAPAAMYLQKHSQGMLDFRKTDFKQDLENALKNNNLHELLNLPTSFFGNASKASNVSNANCSYFDIESNKSLKIDKDNDEIFEICEIIKNIESNSVSLKTLIFSQNAIRIGQIRSDLESYANSVCASKMFSFYYTMLEIALLNHTDCIYFNFKQLTYRYHACAKSIKLWLDELCNLGLITQASKGKKNKEIMFVTLKNYKQSKAFKASMILQEQEKQRLCDEIQKLKDAQQKARQLPQTTQDTTCDLHNSTKTHNKPRNNASDKAKPLLYPQKPFEATISTREQIKNYPLRFFRDMELYLRFLARQSKKKGLVYEFEGEKYVLSPNNFNDLRKWRDIVFEFQSVEDCQKYISIPYHFLTNATPALSIEPYHQNVFKKHIREALKTLLVLDSKNFNSTKGKRNEQIA
ncbi:hypothetical protein [Helicobacter sp. T3_23-1059]